MNIGERIRQARIKSGLSQETAAEKIKVSRQTLSNWENEKTYPDALSLVRIGKVYEVSLDKLLTGDEKIFHHINKSAEMLRAGRLIAVIGIINFIISGVYVIFRRDYTANLIIWAAIVAEFVFVLIIDFPATGSTGKRIKRIFSAACIAFYALIIFVMSCAGFQALKTGNIKDAINMLGTVIVIIVSIYILLVKKKRDIFKKRK